MRSCGPRGRPAPSEAPAQRPARRTPAPTPAQRPAHAHAEAGRIQDPPRFLRAYSVAPQGVTVPVVALTIGVDQTAAGPKSPSPEKVVWMVAISVGPR